MTTYWKELIEIPERVHRDDFVVSLDSGIEQARQTLKDYVVTPELADHFDEALELISSAVRQQRRRAAFLHGSFGSGKSHFMAVLHLLLQNRPEARALRGLSSVVSHHDDWLGQHSFLLVPFHFIGASDVESRLFAGYTEYVKRRHPEAPVPGVFLGDRLLGDADKLRQRMGDAPFFAMFSTGDTDDSGDWGALEQGWDAATYEAAVAAPPGNPERARLLGDLATHVFSSAIEVFHAAGGGATPIGSAAGEGERFVDLDSGLRIIADHAKQLGYEALVLFLDELILWLMHSTAEPGRLQREATKLVKLVESSQSTHPIPTISFVARQRNFRDFMGDALTGTQGRVLEETLGHIQDRFDTITLSDRDLPVIANRRVLKPVNDAAAQAVDESFEQFIARLPSHIRDMLLGNDADRRLFRLAYPFSPALLEALIALSSVLQRERTALRLLVQLLIDHRDDLELGRLVAVGELWDVVAEGGEPFSAQTKQRFETARGLFEQKFQPLLAAEHSVDLAQPREARDATALARMERDGLLIKTLLMAALVPETEAFKNLTVSKLYALNYGTVYSMFSGGEADVVAQKLKRWAAQVPALQLGEGTDPSVLIQLSAVDLDELMERVHTEDNHGTRLREVQELVFKACGLENTDNLFHVQAFAWRAAERTVRVAFENVRKLPDSSIRSHDAVTLLIDYPFDEEGGVPADDVGRLQKFEEDHGEGTQTIAWLPAFLSDDGVDLLSRFVRLRVLDRRPSAYDDLAVELRNEAQSLIRVGVGQARDALKRVLAVAYGVHHDTLREVDQSHEHRQYFYSVIPGLTLQPPGSPTFEGAYRELLEQTFEVIYPEAFELPHERLSRRPLRRLGDLLEGAFASRQASVEVPDRTLRRYVERYAAPLRLAQYQPGSNRFHPDVYWRNELNRLADSETGEIGVTAIRGRLDSPSYPTGLTRDYQDLIILCFAAMANRKLVLHGQAIECDIGTIEDEAILVSVRLPTESDWNRLRELLPDLLGVAEVGSRTPRNVHRAWSEIEAALEPHREAALGLPAELLEAGKKVGVREADVGGTARYRTALAMRDLLRGLEREQTELDRVNRVARWREVDPAIAGRGLKSAGDVLACLSTTDWSVLESFREDPSLHGPQAEGLLQRAREVLAHDELAQSIQALPGIIHTSVELVLDRARSAAQERAERPGSGSPSGTTPDVVGGDQPRGRPSSGQFTGGVPGSDRVSWPARYNVSSRAELATVLERVQRELSERLQRSPNVRYVIDIRESNE